MRLTYTDIKQAHFRNIGKAGQFADTNLMADFNFNLGQRYQTIFGTLAAYITEDTQTFTTTNGTQYYTYPVGTQSLDSVTVTIGNVQYTLNPIYDQQTWNELNALQIQPTAIPQFFFPRKDDFGIFPIPTSTYTGTFQRFYRDRNMLVDDYTTGTVTVTLNSTTLTGSGTTFTPAMVGRWFTVTSQTVPGQGYWYKVTGYTSATVLTLNTTWTQATASGASYRIGESPEIPEDGHIMLPYGTASDYYSGLRNDEKNALRFDNMFWTGSYTNTSRAFGDDNIKSGLIGLANKYQARDRDNIIERKPGLISPKYKVWSYSIS